MAEVTRLGRFLAKTVVAEGRQCILWSDWSSRGRRYEVSDQQIRNIVRGEQRAGSGTEGAG